MLDTAITSRDPHFGNSLDAQVASWEELLEEPGVSASSVCSGLELCDQVHRDVVLELRRAAMKNEVAHPEREASLYHTDANHLQPMANTIEAFYRQGYLYRDEYQLAQIQVALHDLNVPLKPEWTDLDEVRKHFLRVDSNSPLPEDRLYAVLARLVKENSPLYGLKREAEVRRRLANPRPEEVTVAAAEELLDSMRGQLGALGDVDRMIKLTTDAIIHGTTFPLQVAQERGYGFSTNRDIDSNFFAGVLAIADLTSVRDYDDFLNNSRMVYAEYGFSPKPGQTYEEAINQFAYGFLTEAVTVRLDEITSYIEAARLEAQDDPDSRLNRLERMVFSAQAKVTELIDIHMFLASIEETHPKPSRLEDASTKGLGLPPVRHNRHGAVNHSGSSAAA